MSTAYEFDLGEERIKPTGFNEKKKLKLGKYYSLQVTRRLKSFYVKFSIHGNPRLNIPDGICSSGKLPSRITRVSISTLTRTLSHEFEAGNFQLSHHFSHPSLHVSYVVIPGKTVHKLF